MISCHADSVVIPSVQSYDNLDLPPLDTELLKEDRKIREQEQEKSFRNILGDFVKPKKKSKKRAQCRSKKTLTHKPTMSSYLVNVAQHKDALNNEIIAVMHEQYQDEALINTKISLHLKNIPTRDALALISKTSGVHMIIDGDVAGAIRDIRLDNIPLAAALRSVLESNSPRLALIKEFGVWRVGTLATARELFSSMATRNHEKDCTTMIHTIKHAQWNDAFKQRLEKLWQGITGKNTDKNSQYMVLDDVNKKVFARARVADVKAFEHALQALDVSVPQVRLDARVVLADKNFEEVLGFNWSGMYDRSASLKHFNFAGLGVNSPRPAGLDGVTPMFQKMLGWSLNLLPSSAAPTIKMPFVFGDRTMSTKRLNLELNAAETRSEIKTILKPSLLVHNEELAEILVGEELPHQVRVGETIEGKLTNMTSVNYKDIGMKIKVKPTVAPDLHSVFLDVFVENSAVAKPSADLGAAVNVNEGGAQFNYTIQSSRSKSKVLLKSGQTTLIGGLITEGTVKEKNGVPYLQDIPLVGLLFQGSRKKLVDKQLLIFLTPTLVDLETV